MLPKDRQLGQELLQALLLGWLSVVGRGKGHQGGLGFADGMKEGHRIQADAALGQLLFSFIAYCLVQQQPIAGRSRRAVPFERC